jgi:hypothetical protein
MLKRIFIILLGVIISTPLVVYGFWFLGRIGLHDVLRGIWLYMACDTAGTFVSWLLDKLYYSRLKVKEEF